MLNILYYTSTGTELLSLEKAVAELRAAGLRLKLTVFTKERAVLERKKLEELAFKASALVLVPHGGEESLPGL